MMAAVKKVTAGTKLDMALAIDDDAMYNPSKYIVWFNTTLLNNLQSPKYYQNESIELLKPY